MTQGYILIIPDARLHVFDNSIDNGRFAEPVTVFKHKRGSPLVVFISAEENTITHIALGTGGMPAGTDLRRLNLEEIRPLKNPLRFKDLLEKVPGNVRHHIERVLQNGGILSPQSFQKIINAFREIDENLDPLLKRFDEKRYESISKLSQKAQDSLAEQKEAINTALQFADIDRKPLLDWTPNESTPTTSFLDGLPETYVREDLMIVNDLTNFPGFDLIKSSITGHAHFENRNTRLDILLANRTRLEELTGTDLIYYNARYKSFIMVQYKAMEHVVGQGAEFRLPNPQLSEEITRMDETLIHLKQATPADNRHEYRFIDNPFFIKLCPRIVLKPDSIELTPGMYFTLDHWRYMEKDAELVGPNGGRKITYANAGRYITNTNFTNLIRGAWIGTTASQSSILERIIAEILQSGKAVVLAVKSSEPNTFSASVDSDLFEDIEPPF